MHLFLTAFAALLATANSYDAAAAITLAIDIYHSDFAHTIIGDCDFGADLKGCNNLRRIDDCKDCANIPGTVTFICFG